MLELVNLLVHSLDSSMESWTREELKNGKSAFEKVLLGLKFVAYSGG